MTPVEVFSWSVVAFVCVVLSAICSGTEIAFYSLNRVRLDVRAAQTPPDRAARLIRSELERPGRVLTTLLISNNLVNYFGALATSTLFAATAMSEGAIAVASTLVLAPLLFVLGEAAPKELFRVEADRLAYVFARPVTAARLLLTWTGVLPMLQLLTRLGERVAGLKQVGAVGARERLALLLKEGAGHGLLSESQVSLLDRAMLFRQATVGDEMTPWNSVRNIPASFDAARVRRVLSGTTHSRVPVVDARGRVVGVLRVLDLYLSPDKPLADLLLSHARLPKTMRLQEGLSVLAQSKARLGVVEDDLGRPLGIVSAKDLIEPLTGELADL